MPVANCRSAGRRAVGVQANKGNSSTLVEFHC
jgi:hypothetical protein